MTESESTESRPTPVPEPSVTASIVAAELTPEALIVAPAEGCPHKDWELRWSHPKAKRKIEDCTLCGVRRFTDDKDQTLGDPDAHAPWVPAEHREAYEKSRRPA